MLKKKDQNHPPPLPPKPKCAFCRSEIHLVRFPKHNLYACIQCLRRCAKKLAAEEIAEITPQKTKEWLDEYVVGQKHAKHALAVAARNHIKRLLESGEKIIGKSNMILVGPSGCGKTLIATSLAKILNLPFVSVDCSKLTEAGYVGEDVPEIAKKALVAANYNSRKAARAIVFLDELDKSAEKATSGKDVRGEGVQRGLLRLVEGGKYNVEREEGFNAKNYIVDTTQMLFIAAGAFEEATRRAEERTNGHNVAGFKQKDASPRLKKNSGKILPEDLRKSGFLPELIGRFPVIIVLEPIDEEIMLKIITEPKTALWKQYQKIFELSSALLEADDGALRLIAKKALASKTGARNLRGIFESLLLDAMFDIEAFCTYTIKIVDGDLSIVKKKPH